MKQCLKSEPAHNSSSGNANSPPAPASPNPRKPDKEPDDEDINKTEETVDEFIKFGKSQAPKNSTPNSIYEQLNPDGTVRSRTFYDSNGNPFSRQDFNHSHGGMQPHEHIRTLDPVGKPITSISKLILYCLDTAIYLQNNI